MLFSRLLLRVLACVPLEPRPVCLVQETPPSSHHLFSASAARASWRRSTTTSPGSSSVPGWKWRMSQPRPLIIVYLPRRGWNWPSLGTQQNEMTNKPEPAAWCPNYEGAIPRRDALRIRIPPPSVARRVMFNRDGPGRPEKKLLPPVPDLYPDAPRVLHLGGTVNMTNSWKKRLFHIAESGQLVDSQEERKLAATPGSAGLDQSVARLAAVASRGCLGSLDPRSRVTRRHHH